MHFQDKNADAPVNEQIPPGFVFFVEGRIDRRIAELPWRRRPRIAVDVALNRLVAAVQGFPCTHVAFGFSGAVIDPVRAGNRYWPMIQYIETYPGIGHIFEIPLSSPPDLDSFDAGKPKPTWPTVLRWWTAGRWPQTEDCVQTVCRCLELGGVAAPRRMLTPKQLFQWLKSEGYKHAPIDEQPDSGADG